MFNNIYVDDEYFDLVTGFIGIDHETGQEVEFREWVDREELTCIIEVDGEYHQVYVEEYDW